MDLSNLPSIGRDLLNARMHRAKVSQPSCPLKLHEQEKKVLVAQNYSAIRGPVNAMREQFFFGDVPEDMRKVLMEAFAVLRAKGEEW